ncbi:uncharacterized protein LOC128954994 [Oppia nitens]|uniref:uncharacterized protein LOC128954994 n=1 Tax=Oppia nitens TaxID=1686743 RepID=UPI0023DC3A7C|nr:uncharacterized protein LOC128954994 [Oppia nitens]
MTIGTGVFVDNRVLLTCCHVVKHSPIVWIQYVITYENRPSDSVSKSEQLLVICPRNLADVLYVEPHNDLALVRLRDPPSPVYNTSTPMPVTTSPESTDFGSPVAMLGHGGNVRFALHPGMVITPQVDNYLIPINYYISIVSINDKLPIVTHSTIALAGNSGGPVIDSNGQLCGICYGGIIKRGQISYAIGSQILMEFMDKALAYESDNRKHNRLRKLYEWDIGSNTRLLGLIFHTQPFSGSFTVQTALPSATNNAKKIIGTNALKIDRQDFDSIDIIRSAIVNETVITVSFRYPTDGDNSQTGRVIRPKLEDMYKISGEGTGVFVGHRLLLTCYHVVKHNPIVWIQYVRSYDNQVLVTCPMNMADVLSIGVLCMPLSMLWMAYNKQPSFQTTTTTKGVRPMSAKTNNPFSIRSAALMANNNNTGADNINGYDMIAMKNRCIRSIGYIIRPLLEDPDTDGGTGSGVFVANRLLLTCYHVVKQSPAIWVVYVRSYDNQVMTNLIMGAEVLYVEPHWDLALVQLHQWPSPIYNTAKSMLLATSGNQIIDFGEPVATIGHGQDLRFGLHPGMITIPRVDSYLIPVSYYISLVPFNEKMPIITHNTVNIYGFSGCPLIDTEGRMCGMVWGGISKRGLVSYALDSITIKEFVVRGLTYQRDGIKQNRLRERYEWDIQDPDTRLLGLILSKQQQPFSCSFTVQSVLPTVSEETKRIIGSCVTKVFGQEFNNIAVIRSAIGTNRVIKLSIELPTDDDSSSSSSSSGSSSSDSQGMTVRQVVTVNINTIAPVDNQGFRIKPLVI